MKKRWIVVAISLLVGSLLVLGQERRRTRERYPVTKYDLKCFTLPSGVLVEDSPVLLNQCNGDTWKFARGYGWEKIEREP